MTCLSENQALTDAIFNRLKDRNKVQSDSKSTSLKLSIQRYCTNDASSEGLPKLPSLCQSKNIVYLNSTVRWNRSTLVMLFQEQNTPNEESPSKLLKADLEDAGTKPSTAYIPLVAFKTLESTKDSDHKALSYIQWIDTSGLTKPRGLQSSITRGLLWGYYDFLTTIGISYVSLFATPHQDYQIGNTNSTLMSFIFKGSEMNPRKNQLVGKDVAHWWLRHFFQYKKEKNRESQIYLFRPCASNNEKEAFIGGENIAYTPGLPFKIDCASSIPLFPDDPIASHLASFIKEGEGTEKIHEKTFVSSLAFRQEYQRCVGAAHVFFELPPPRSREILYQEPESGCTIEMTVDKILEETMFSSDMEALGSASQLGAIVGLDALDAFVYYYAEDVPDKIPKSIAEKARAPIRDLQSLIKRKK
jgi:hypothetical protein